METLLPLDKEEVKKRRVSRLPESHTRLSLFPGIPLLPRFGTLSDATKIHAYDCLKTPIPPHKIHTYSL